MKLATRLNKIEEPKTILMAKLSRELRSKGVDVIDLSLGEPDFQTPASIIKSAKKAMDDGYTKYPPVAGFPELRQAIVDKFKNENNLSFETNQILVSTGAKQCLFNAVMSVVNEGDEAIVPSPYWVTYQDIVKMADGVIKTISATFENDFKITPMQLEAAITPKSKLFIFSSPCNPTGSIYSKEELKELANVFAKYPDIFIISDEIYEHINFEGTHESIAQFDEIKDRVIIVNGLSKSFAMTGWRLGYMAAHQDIITASEKIQSQVTSGANSITQRAAITALSGSLESTQAMVEEFKARRDYMVDALREIKGLEVNKPTGAFYLFPDIRSYYGKKGLMNADHLCMYLLNEAHVSCVSGDSFGNPNCIRLSYAASLEKLKEAVKRLKVAFENLDQ